MEGGGALRPVPCRTERHGGGEGAALPLRNRKQASRASTAGVCRAHPLPGAECYPSEGPRTFAGRRPFLLCQTVPDGFASGLLGSRDSARA